MLKFVASCVVLFSIYCYVEAQLHIECVTPNNEEATCESIYKCKAFLNILNSTTESQQKFMRASLCGRINEVPIVCCGTKTDYTGTPKPKRETQLIPKNSCGISVIDDEPKSETSTKTLNKEFPWTARLQQNSSSHFSCEGTLINSRYVLTAGLCLSNDIIKRLGNIVKVRLGAHNCDGKDCQNIYTDFGVEETFIHPNYPQDKSVVGPHDDIGLIRLDKEVTFSDAIRPICLPDPSSAALKEGDLLTETGWFRNSPDQLKVDLPFVSLVECQSIYSKAAVSLPQTNMCAGGKNDKQCAGLSGGPLMKNDGGKWSLRGIVSFGPHPCAQGGTPNVYTDVLAYLEWIHTTVKP